MSDDDKEMLKYYGDQLTRIRELNKALEDKVKDMNDIKTQRNLLFAMSCFFLVSITMF
jgi:hypothetical protein|tara:strand:+ start:1071 stop:1244 length:174 start_codon:yes stop_codon:yes gene_type:complete